MTGNSPSRSDAVSSARRELRIGSQLAHRVTLLPVVLVRVGNQSVAVARR